MTIKTGKRISKKSPLPKNGKAAPNPNPPHANQRVAAGAAPPARPATPTKPVPRLGARRPLPAKSLRNAAQAFKNFNLSRFAKGSTPANYVPAGQAKVTSTVSAVQRKAIAQQLTALSARTPTNPGLTVALPDALLKSLLPSLTGTTVDLTQFLSVLRQQMSGTELYAIGEPTITRVVQQAQQLAQVQAFINAVKTGGA